MRLRKSSGLVLDLCMDEGSGAVAGDSSRYGNDGALTGCKWVENGLEFNGSSDYVDCGNDESLDITDAITISAWIKFDSFSLQHIIGRDDGTNRNFFIDTDGTKRILYVLFFSGAVKIAYSSTLSENTWYHIAGVYDGSNMNVYTNGVAGTPLAFSGVIDNDNVAFSIGAREGGLDRFFNGSIDQVRIHNRALSAREIMKYYEATKHKYL